MLIAILALAFVHFNATGVWTFNYEDLLKTPMSHGVGYLLMLGFFIAFAVKNAGGAAARLAAGRSLPGADRRPLSTSRGSLLKTAAYGLLALALPLFPNASAEFAPIAMWLGVIGIFYGAWMAFAQTDIKRLIASHLRVPHGLRADCYLHRQPAGLSGSGDPDDCSRSVRGGSVYSLRPAVRTSAYPRYAPNGRSVEQN